jgi:ABC-2 type transport system permease protein
MPDLRAVSQQWRRLLAITRKDVRVYYTKGPVVISGILFPIFLAATFTIGRNLPMDSLITGLVGMTLFFAATSVSPMIVPFEAQARTLERLMSSPVRFEVIILGDILASFVYGVAISLILIIIALLVGITIAGPFILAIAIILGGFCFAALASIFSVPPTNLPATTNMIGTLVRFPIVFISGVFTPLNQLSGWGRALSYISPLTYFTDVARYSVQKSSYFTVAVDLLALVFFTVLFLVTAMILHLRTMTRRI